MLTPGWRTFGKLESRVHTRSTDFQKYSGVSQDDNIVMSPCDPGCNSFLRFMMTPCKHYIILLIKASLTKSHVETIIENSVKRKFKWMEVLEVKARKYYLHKGQMKTIDMIWLDRYLVSCCIRTTIRFKAWHTTVFDYELNWWHVGKMLSW